MRHGNITTRIREERPCIPCLSPSVFVKHQNIIRIPTVSSSKSSNSAHLLTHWNGFWMPSPVSPTQYDISTMRASSSSSAKSLGETEVLLLAELSRVVCAGNPTVKATKERRKYVMRLKSIAAVRMDYLF